MQEDYGRSKNNLQAVALKVQKDILSLPIQERLRRMTDGDSRVPRDDQLMSRQQHLQ